jgi:hypothetical protein
LSAYNPYQEDIMQAITYRVVTQAPDGATVIGTVTVEARDINSGFRKAISKALATIAGTGRELVEVTFWEIPARYVHPNR